MTNEQTIEILKGYKQRLENSCSNLLDEDLQALDVAIKALEEIEGLKEENHRNFVNSHQLVKINHQLVKEIENLKRSKGYGKFECSIKIKDLISMLLEFDMNRKATIYTYDEDNIVISIKDTQKGEEE